MAYRSVMAVWAQASICSSVIVCSPAGAGRKEQRSAAGGLLVAGHGWSVPIAASCRGRFWLAPAGAPSSEGQVVRVGLRDRGRQVTEAELIAGQHIVTDEQFVRMPERYDPRFRVPGPGEFTAAERYWRNTPNPTMKYAPGETIRNDELPDLLSETEMRQRQQMAANQELLDLRAENAALKRALAEATARAV